LAGISNPFPLATEFNAKSRFLGRITRGEGHGFWRFSFLFFHFFSTGGNVMYQRLMGLAAVWLVVQPALAQFTDFEDLTLSTNYPVGSTFTSNGLSFKVVKFGSNGVAAQVGNFGYAGGGGKEMWLGNTVGLDFQLAGPASRVSMQFGTFCCQTGVVVNGVASALSGDLNALNGMNFGGVAVSASEANSRGTMELTGPINSLIVGGTEFAIDNVRVVPEPTSVSLALIAMAILAIGQGRRRA
jgi:hypothetical protein